MSGWRIAAKNLHALGGFGTTKCAGRGIAGSAYEALSELRRRGLATGERISSRGYVRPILWRLTEEGRAFCESLPRPSVTVLGQRFDAGGFFFAPSAPVQASEIGSPAATETKSESASGVPA